MFAHANAHASGSADPLHKPDYRAKKHGKPIKPAAYRQWRQEPIGFEDACRDVARRNARAAAEWAEAGHD